MRLRALLAVAGALLMVVPTTSAVADDRGRDCDWTQWGQGATHNGVACVRDQRDLRLLARIVVDPFAEQEDTEGGGIPVHYPVPLVDNDGNVFALKKGGSFVSCDPPGSGEPAPCGLDPGNLNRMTWSVQALRWRHDQLVPQWTFATDWKPTQRFFEAMVQSAMTDDSIYVPGAGGTVFQLSKRDGRVQRRINPLGTAVDPDAFVAGSLTLDSRGTLFYNVIKGEESWLVRVDRNRIGKVGYASLIPGAPSPDSLCYTNFQVSGAERPYPPPPQPDGSPTLPRQARCGPQRAAMNAAPAVGPDGTIVTLSRPAGPSTENYSYLVAFNPDLSLKWASSLRVPLNDGCGVLVPYGTGFYDCRPGAAPGVDPTTNLAPAASVLEQGSAAPVILPDGNIIYGARTSYNGFRGHLLKFDNRGRYLANYDFGWDITPGVLRHDGTYSLLIKDNHYLTNGPFDLTLLNAGLKKDWSFTNTETRTCQRNPDGSITCTDDGEHPNGFEWCVAAPVIDRDGTIFGLSEDGNLYVIDKHGKLRERVFLSKTVASAYTPLSLDSRGRVYAQNNGEMYVLGH